MGKLTRFGVSLDEELLEPFDALCAVKGYSNRSEAIRDLIRKALVAEEWQQADGQGAGTLTLVYDHHKNDLARRLRAHKTGRGARYTRARGAVRLAYAERCESKSAAMRREAALKRLPKAEKERLAADWQRQNRAVIRMAVPEEDAE